MTKKTKETKTIIPHTNLLEVSTLIFVVLKLTHNIDWNWFWVLSPILIPTILILGTMAALSMMVYIKILLE